MLMPSHLPPIALIPPRLRTTAFLVGGPTCTRIAVCRLPVVSQKRTKKFQGSQPINSWPLKIKGNYFVALGFAKHKASCCDKARCQNLVLMFNIAKSVWRSHLKRVNWFVHKKLVRGCVPHTSIRVPPWDMPSRCELTVLQCSYQEQSLGVACKKRNANVYLHAVSLRPR